jgi:hypothetical protein
MMARPERALKINAALKRITLAAWLRAIANLSAGGGKHGWDEPGFWVIAFGKEEFPHRAVLERAARPYVGFRPKKGDIDGPLGQAMRRELKRHGIPTRNLKLALSTQS